MYSNDQTEIDGGHRSRRKFSESVHRWNCEQVDHLLEAQTSLLDLFFHTIKKKFTGKIFRTIPWLPTLVFIDLKA